MGRAPVSSVWGITSANGTWSAGSNAPAGLAERRTVRFDVGIGGRRRHRRTALTSAPEAVEARGSPSARWAAYDGESQAADGW